ncbi:insA C-terminal domain protein [Escherichia coli BCE032_MS-12]|nr:insA C-terminal domain protein [Escherichia coli BCE032_MS-12]ENB35417.1 insA C-terminal domain protein [Escherichia coli BCE032_MS-12]ENB39849.1 insA C-terminal domain protein [Escherichia coli BCE032_MS-12]
MRNGKSTADISAISALCRKTWQLSSLTPLSPGTHQKIIDMAMNGVGCRATPALWALASTRFSAI